MVFSSAIFLLGFLPIVFISNFFAKGTFSNIVLLLSSLIFYAWGEPLYVMIMMLSIIINWALGNLIEKSKGKKKKILLAIGIICNLSILCYFKYLGFFVSVFNRLIGNDIISVPTVTLPIGISFFTFQAISYIADIYKGETEASPKLVNVALYISFFPQLIAGPIVKYRDISRQVEERTITWQNVSFGFKRFIYGLSKKVLIANVLANCVDKIYSYDISVVDSKMAWIGALAYSFQIYYDFSGYSDMAIGLGKMFGFSFLENFDYPYMSRSITEFWRRWHISLGSWFKEYVYIPLGGNRNGRISTYRNLCIVFLLTGLWHGANYSFILWGIYHGTFQIIERLGFNNFLEKNKIFSSLYCFFVVNLGWVLFRANNVGFALQYMSRMLLPWYYSKINIPFLEYFNIKTLFIIICAVIGMGLLKRLFSEKLISKWQGSALEAIYCVALLILSLASIASDTYNPFIYYQF